MAVMDRILAGLQKAGLISIGTGGGGGVASAGRVVVSGVTASTSSTRPKVGQEWIQAYNTQPWLRATVNNPASKMGELLTYPGVTHIEKDRLVSLQDDIPLEKENSHPMAYAVEDVAGVEVKAVDPTRFKPDTTPAGYANFGYTGADKIWEDTGYGEGTVVAVVDSGTVRNPCLQHAVIGAPGFPDGYNATGDGISPVDPRNYWHGTVVGGAIASSCVLDLSGNPSDPLYQAISRYLPWPADSVPIYGQAPKAQLYPVKVFDVTGRPTPTSLVLEGLDHILTLKKGGLLDRYRQPGTGRLDCVRRAGCLRSLPQGAL